MTDPTPNTRDATLRAQAAFDGELDSFNALAFERDVAADPDLRRAYERASAASAAVGAAVPREKAPDALRARVLALAQEPKTARRQGLAWAASLAVAAFLAGAGADHYLGGAGDDETPTLVADFARAQIANQPFDIASSDRHTVKPWLAARVAFGGEAVDLAEQGFPLAGGRVDIVARAPVATFVYRRREHFIALTELPRRAQASGGASLDGFPIERWSDDQRSYVAVSDVDAADLAAFARAFREKAAKPGGETR